MEIFGNLFFHHVLFCQANHGLDQRVSIVDSIIFYQKYVVSLLWISFKNIKKKHF